MKGLEYVLVHSIPDQGIFHIRKQYRHAEKRITGISMYFVHGGKVYEAPNMYKILNTRIRNISLSL